MDARILIVEDDPSFGPLLAEYLTEEGLAVGVESRGDRAVDRILDERPDLVVLDLMLPGLDGFEVHRRVRPAYDGIVLVLTARRSDLDQVALLEMGADDYVTKPVDPRVLFARIKAHLRRMDRSSTASGPPVLDLGRLVVDRTRRRATWDAVALDLTGLELELLWTLGASAGQVVARALLYERVLGARYDGLDRGIDGHVSRLRRKLRDAGADEDAIISVRGIGYQLTVHG